MRGERHPQGQPHEPRRPHAVDNNVAPFEEQADRSGSAAIEGVGRGRGGVHATQQPAYVPLRQHPLQLPPLDPDSNRAFAGRERLVGRKERVHWVQRQDGTHPAQVVRTKQVVTAIHRPTRERRQAPDDSSVRGQRQTCPAPDAGVAPSAAPGHQRTATRSTPPWGRVADHRQPDQAAIRTSSIPILPIRYPSRAPPG